MNPDWDDLYLSLFWRVWLGGRVKPGHDDGAGGASTFDVGRDFQMQEQDCDRDR